jgi:CBS domain-containing protein
MMKDVPTVVDNVTALVAAKVMMDAGRGFVVVLKEGQPAGIVTEHDLVNKIIVAKKNAAKVLAVEIMSSPLITIDPDEDLTKASELMHEHKIRRLLVVKDSIIYGAITTTDIARSLSQYVDQSVKDLLRWSAIR